MNRSGHTANMLAQHLSQCYENAHKMVAMMMKVKHLWWWIGLVTQPCWLRAWGLDHDSGDFLSLVVAMREGRRCISVARWADHDNGDNHNDGGGGYDGDNDEGSAQVWPGLFSHRSGSSGLKLGDPKWPQIGRPQGVHTVRFAWPKSGA